ncbi:uncharacterized protein LOC134182603 isoform X2 [Corticium candelabrum]|uniref:uncharacterized protein LOC134182603 isoform X2 n=1 Tax=Corticium candelabrum TaxID=121492 RepID=UPI002E26AF6C|nr:uncharacterized protein LOC134182603 isoform X2 [Corticium candelabrum]
MSDEDELDLEVEQIMCENRKDDVSKESVTANGMNDDEDSIVVEGAVAIECSSGELTTLSRDVESADKDSNGDTAGGSPEVARMSENELTNVDHQLDRLQLFSKGLAFERNAKPAYALKCYMDCLKDLKDGTSFSKLPQCLHRIADIYYEDKQYEKALQFIQAEKLYYEKALIDLGDLLGNQDEKPNISNADVLAQSAIPESDSHLVNKAAEYEKLARLCLEDQKPHLALEYCGKATKIQQSVFGDSHPITLQTLELFTSIYAEVGRLQYCDAMKRYTNGSGDTNVNSTECDETTGSETAHMEPDSVCTNSVPDVAVSNVGASETKDSTEADSSEKIGEHTDNNAVN